MDPKAAYLAYLATGEHEYYNDLCAWFQKGGCGFEANYNDRPCFVEKLTYTHDAHIRYRNNKRAVVTERKIYLVGSAR